MKTLCLVAARLSLSGWIGAAALYVVTSVHEQTSPRIDSPTRDILAAIRFPDYYAFGFVMTGAALVFGVLALPRIRRVLFGLLLLAAIGCMVWDYFQVFQPLLQLITPPGQSRTEEFARLHNLSKLINEIDVSLCAVAAIILNWPVRWPKADKS